jgi:hypothetical protein
MPSLAKITDYWADAAETAAVLPSLAAHSIGWGEPFCFGCGWLAPVSDGPNAWRLQQVSGWLERAHLVGHFLGGSSEPDNLVPLCHFCHEDMPELIEDRSVALAWVDERRSLVPREDLWQMFTDAVAKPGRGSRQARMHRLRADYLQILLALHLDGSATQVADEGCIDPLMAALVRILPD